MNNRNVLRILVALLVFVALFSVAQSAEARVGLTDVFKAWDRNSLSFKDTGVDIFWDGGSVEFYSRLGFNRNDYTIVAEDASSCSVGATSKWAGRVVLALAHTDNSPSGAAGFSQSQAWSIVDCDFDGNGSYGSEDDFVDLSANPPTEWSSAEFTVISSDVVFPCRTDNCQDGLVTTMFVNVDSDCDNRINPDINKRRVCFFAQGVTPDLASGPPYWGGPLQALFLIPGGPDNVVTFNAYGPTAITLEQLVAQSPGGIHPAVWLTIFVLLAAIAFVLIRESRGQKDQVRIQREEQ